MKLKKLNLSTASTLKLSFILVFIHLGTSGCSNQKETFHYTTYESHPKVRAKDKIEHSFHIPTSAASIKRIQVQQNLKPEPIAFPKREASKKEPISEVVETSEVNPLSVPEVNPSSANVSKDNDSGLGTSGYKVEIRRSALNKEFLLQSSMIVQPRVALGSGLKSRIVRFIERGDQIVLLDSVDGNSVSKDIPQNLVLAVFPVLKRTKDNIDEIIQFDFNKGMSELFVTEDWRASDISGIGYNPGLEYASQTIQQAYIEEMFFEENHLILRQVARLSTMGRERNLGLVPTEVKYYLSPYRPSSSFKPVALKQNFEWMGFFEAAPYQSENAPEHIHISKFDETKPIIFAVSANTPEPFKQAVIDGILYWNKAYGKEIIKVIDAPKGVSAPDLKYNVVQWVNWDNAGFAYADAQMDPRTGEILHAQVYFTSIFAVSGKRSARKLLKKFSEEQALQKERVHQVGLNGFIKKPLCNLSITNSFISSLSNMVNSGVDDAQILKASQDYVREVSAHEIGHTLGLRHNFAGSLAANYAGEERPQIIRNYFNNGKTDDGLITSSSVMEYQVFEESIMTGDQIAKLSTALPYDEKAIQTLYYGKVYNPEELPLFCTDSHVSKRQFIDCAQFDVGSSIVDAKGWNPEKAGRTLLESIISTYIYAKAPLRGEKPISIQKVALPEAKLFGMNSLRTHFEFLKLLNGKSQFLKIQRQYPVVDGGNSEAVKKEEIEYVLAEINKRGGVKKFLFDLEPNITEAWIQSFERILESNRKGVGFDDQEYEFSDAEMTYIKSKVTHYLKQIGLEMQKINLGILSGTAAFAEQKITETLVFSNPDLFSEIPSHLGEIARKYLFSETGEKQDVEIEVGTTEKDKKKVVVQLPTYRYPHVLRAMALGMLKHKTEENQFLFVLERKKTEKLFNETMTKIFTVPLSSIKAENMPTPAAAQWVLENQSLNSSL